jgi:hypothetical protein
MKCPVCNSKLSWKNRTTNPRAKECYLCPSCQAISVPKHGVIFFVVFFLIAAPIIEFAVQYITEGLLQGLTGNIVIVGWQLPRILSVLITIGIMVGIYFRLNRLMPIKPKDS